MEWDEIPAAGPESVPQELIERSAAELEEFLDEKPDAKAEVLEILGRRIEIPPTGSTWAALLTSLSEYMGEAPATLVLWSSVADSDEEDRARRVQRLEESGQETSATLVRSVRAAYGQEIQRAWELVGAAPDNWRWIDRTVYLDIVREQSFAKIKITKFNGEDFMLELPADSLLALVTYLVVTMTSMGDATTFDDSLIAEFLAENNILVEMLQVPSAAPTRST